MNQVWFKSQKPFLLLKQSLELLAAPNYAATRASSWLTSIIQYCCSHLINFLFSLFSHYLCAFLSLAIYLNISDLSLLAHQGLVVIFCFSILIFSPLILFIRGSLPWIWSCNRFLLVRGVLPLHCHQMLAQLESLSFTG